jgi:hypothetical protein
MAEKTTTSGEPTLLIPRFVRGLNVIAERAGFRHETHVGKLHWDGDEQHLIAVWRGSRRAFRRLTFLPPTHLRKAHTGGGISWPEPPHMRPIILGIVEISGKGIRFTLSFGPPPRAIRTQGNLEIVEYCDWYAYCGAKEELMATGICTEKQFPDKNMCKNSRYDSGGLPEWKMRRYPNGSFVFWRETDAAAEARHREWVEQRRAIDEWAEQRRSTQPGEALSVLSTLGNIISLDAYRRARHRREWDRLL